MLAPLNWPLDALERLCEQQHLLQERHLDVHEPHAAREMVVVDGRTVGRVCLDRERDPWRIIDLVILPEAQDGGIGTAVLRRVLANADAAGAAVELQVGVDNPRAASLYRREGFSEALTGSATHLRMVARRSARFS